MEEVWKEVLSDFDAVWQRVKGNEEALPTACGEAAARLRDFYRTEAAGEAYYTVMEKLAPQRDAALFRGLGYACGRHCRQLRTELFLLTGEEVLPEQHRFPHDGYLGQIRRAYQREGVLASQYLAASAEAFEPRLRELFSSLAAASAGRREQLYTLAQRLLR